VTLTRETVAAWLRAYVQAWETCDPDAVADLFTEDATYAYHPFDEPIRGRLAIVASWLKGKDPAGTSDGRYEAVGIDSPIRLNATIWWGPRAGGLDQEPFGSSLILQPKRAAKSFTHGEHIHQ